jgi:hypothetical protein
MSTCSTGAAWGKFLDKTGTGLWQVALKVSCLDETRSERFERARLKFQLCRQQGKVKKMGTTLSMQILDVDCTVTF